MTTAVIREELIEFLNSVVRPGQDVRSVSDKTNLVDAGVIDSLALIQIIHYLETRHDLYLHDLGIDPPANFKRCLMKLSVLPNRFAISDGEYLSLR